jgi:iron complex outermembrane receptor protein
VAVLLLLFGSVLWAQDPPPPPGKRDLADLSIDELMNIDVKVVFAASRYAQKISDAPASVTLVGAENIRKYGYRTLADALRSVPGLYVSNDRNYSYLGMRGFGLPSDFNSRVLFTLDGHRVNENLFDGALIGGEFPLDIDLVERIEVIRGPGSALYGSNAFFGVVNIMTRSPASIDGAELSASTGSFGTNNARASVGKRFENGVEVLLSATGSSSDGQDLHFKAYDDPATGSGHSDNDEEDYVSGFAKLAWGPFTAHATYVTRTKEIPTGAYGTIFPSRRSRTWDERAYADLAFAQSFEGGLSVLARVYLDTYAYRGNYEYDAGGGATYLNKDQDVGTWWGGELKLTQDLWSGRAKLTLGGEARENIRQDQKNYDDVFPKATYLDSNEGSYFTAAYAQVDAALLDFLRANVGLRADHYSTFGNSANPRAALIGTLAEGVTLKALYGRAFRAPNAFEHYYSDGGVYQKPNPDLSPETIDTYEAIATAEFGKHASAEVNAFHYRIKDLISKTTDPNDGLVYFENLDRVRAVGGGVTFEMRLDNGIRGTASYTYSEAKNDETDRRLPNSPRHVAKANLSVPLVDEQVFAGLELQYIGERPTLAGNRADDSVLVNLTLYSRELLQGLSLSASIYNLFDVKAEDPVGSELIQDVIEQDGRAFRIKLTWRF